MLKGRYLVLIVLALLFMAGTVSAIASTEVTVTKLANDGVTVLDQVTVNYTWMMDNLPVYGDGVTHYYHQGPTFDPDNLWDPGETVNIDTRDYGAAMGTDVKDLCDLVGGMNEGEWVKILATDPFSKNFDYDDVYEPEPELGRMVVAWYNPTFGGYPPDYSTGMRLIFFANTTNTDGKYVFGNWDMHETLNESRWHYYYDGTNFWPSSSGLSVQNVNRIDIYSDDPVPTPVDVLFDGTVTLTPGATFDVIPYNNLSASYTVNETTPLGALEATGLSYDVTDKNYGASGALLLDNIGTYLYQKTPRKAWYAYVNDVYKDGYNNPAGGLNLIALNDGDTVEFYYVNGTVADPTDLTAVKAAATAAVKTVADISTGPVMDVLYDGTVTLTL